MVLYEVKQPLDILWNNIDLNGFKPVALTISGSSSINLYATEKEITVSQQRKERGYKSFILVSDHQQYPRCCSLGKDISSIRLQIHPIHERENQASDLLVYVPKSIKQKPYFKVRRNFRYLLTIISSKSDLSYAIVKTDGTTPPAAETIRLYQPTITVLQSVPNLPSPSINLKPLCELPPNPLLEQICGKFQSLKHEERLQQLLVMAQTGQDLRLTCLRWTRYALYDVNMGRRYTQAGSELNAQILQLYHPLTQLYDLLWRYFFTLLADTKTEETMQEFANRFVKDPHQILSKCSPLFQQIIPLLNRIYETKYAQDKLEVEKRQAITWPHTTYAMQQLVANGFVYNPTHLQPDRMVCSECNSVGYAWHRLVSPMYHHDPRCRNHPQQQSTN